LIENPTLAAIRERRSIRNFTSEAVTEEQLEAILDSARWAPSGLNSQPWDFVVVRDAGLRSEMGTILKRTTWAWGGFAAAPTLIVVAVDPSRDPEHFVEDGAVAAQNLCLGAQSLGLGSAWAGVFSPRNKRGSVENDIKQLLSLPNSHRVIAVVPIGVANRAGKATRRPLAEMVHYDAYTPKEDSRPRSTTAGTGEAQAEIRRIHEPTIGAAPGSERTR
jgi:nitroreductase